MCCNSPTWTPKANHAKCLAIAVLIFGCVDLLAFFTTAWLAGIAAILAIVSASLLICCGPKSPSPQAGNLFKAASILSFIASALHLAGAIWLIIAVIAISTNANNVCLNVTCRNWERQGCGSSAFRSLCTSEAECRSDPQNEMACGIGASAGVAFANIILWPVIIITIVQAALGIAYGVNSWQAAATMIKPQEPQQPTFSGAVTQPPVAVPVAQPVAKADAV